MRQRFPPFLYITIEYIMIDLAALRTEIEQMLHEDEFIVEVISLPGDQIRVVVDAMGGLPISRCVELSRTITELHDRDVEEDYALEVSSPSLSDPWQVYKQYTRHLGAPVQAVEASGMKWCGKLIEVGDMGQDELPEYVILEVERTETIQDGKKKRKQLIVEPHRIEQAQLKRISYDLDKAL